MIIKDIIISGYSSYKDKSEVKPDMGITGVFGTINNNPDQSNSSGKSSLLMSITYALYGEGEFDRVEELQNDQSDSMSVKIIFELMHSAYSVERGLQKGKSYLIFMQDTVRVGDSIASSQEEINKLLGMDYSMFSASIFFEQGNMDKFINVPAETRRKYVDKVIGNEIWTDLYKTNTKALKDLGNTINSTDEHIKSINNAIAQNNIILKSKNSINDIITLNTKLLQDAQNELKIYAAFSENKKALEDLYAQKSDIKTQVDKVLAQLSEQLSIINNPINYDIIIENINNLIIESTNNRTITQESLLQTQELITDTSTKLDSVNKEIFKIDALISSKESEIQDISESTCTKCGTVIDTIKISQNNKSINIAIDESKQLVTLHRLTLAALSAEKDKLIKTELSLKAKIEVYTQELQSFTDNRSNSTAAKINESTRINNARDQQAFLEKSRDTLIIQEKAVNSKISTLEPLCINNDEKDTKIQNIESNIAVYTETLAEANKSLGRLELTEASTSLLLSNLADYNVSQVSNKKEFKLLEVAVEAFKAIPKQIFEESIREVETLANAYIHEFFPHVSVQFYEDSTKKNNPLIISCIADNKTRGYKRLSGGQRTVVNIGLRLGFSKILMKRAKTQLQFLVLDEPFGALDASNRLLIKKVLKSLSDQFKQIFIITHTEDESDFQNVIRVKMTSDACSYI